MGPESTVQERWFSNALTQQISNATRDMSASGLSDGFLAHALECMEADLWPLSAGITMKLSLCNFIQYTGQQQNLTRVRRSVHE